MRIKHTAAILTFQNESGDGVIPKEGDVRVGASGVGGTRAARALLIVVELLAFLGQGGDNVLVAF